MLLVLAVAGWRDLSVARAKLNDARASLVALADNPSSLRTASGRATARRDVDRAQRSLDAARRRIQDSLALRAVGVVPGFSRQRTGALALVRDARSGADVALRLLASVDQVAGHERVRDGSVPLDALGRVGDELRRAGADLATTTGPAGGLWGPLGEARRTLNATAARTSRRLRETADGLDAARSFLGGDGPRRHLIAGLNNAEMRDQGMVLSFAIVRVEDGRLSVERSGPINDLVVDHPIAYPVPAGMDHVFGGLAPNRIWQSVNASADFAWSGRAMAEMAQQATGQPVDGVVAIDVVGLTALLRVVGPVQVEGVAGAINADNAADVLLNRFYVNFPRQRDQAERKERLGIVIEALVSRMTSGSFDAVQLASELGDAAAGGHLHLWSAGAMEEATFERIGLGGGPGVRAPERTLHIAVQNATATKLDYFVKPRVDIRISLAPTGAAVINTDVVVVNTAPVDAPDSYQFGPDGFFQSRPGQYIARVYLWGPRGAEQQDSVEESGLRLSRDATTVEPGEERTVRFQTVIPHAVRNGHLDLRLVPQPRLVPMKLRVILSAPGWRVDGPKSVETTWERVINASWGVHREGGRKGRTADWVLGGGALVVGGLVLLAARVRRSTP
ncbi:MAG: DUF4012 domain-containing protein [Acidimicrobiales bacterium]